MKVTIDLDKLHKQFQSGLTSTLQADAPQIWARDLIHFSRTLYFTMDNETLDKFDALFRPLIEKANEIYDWRKR